MVAVFLAAPEALLPVQAATGANSTASPDQPDAIDVPAPELVGGPWLNTAGGKPITLASRRGKVTVVEFWKSTPQKPC
jgi:hypothetical protein